MVSQKTFLIPAQSSIGGTKSFRTRDKRYNAVVGKKVVKRTIIPGA